MLSVSLDCPILIAPLVFSNVYETSDDFNLNSLVDAYLSFDFQMQLLYSIPVVLILTCLPLSATVKVSIVSSY
jgi:hypothetical protein